MKKPIINRLRCKKCNDVIESKHVHDLQRCKCGAIFVDGGHELQRYGWGLDRPGKTLPVEDYIDFSLSVYQDEH